MDIIAAATQTQQSMPYQSAPAYQNTTVQPDRPAPKPSLAAKAFGYGYLIGYLAVVIFVVFMIYRFVKATEKIADKLEKGIVIKKDDTTT